MQTAKLRLNVSAAKDGVWILAVCKVLSCDAGAGCVKFDLTLNPLAVDLLRLVSTSNGIIITLTLEPPYPLTPNNPSVMNVIMIYDKPPVS